MTHPTRRSPLAGDGWGTMTRFRQVTSPASGLLRSLILDSVLFGNRLKSDRLLALRDATDEHEGAVGGPVQRV